MTSKLKCCVELQVVDVLNKLKYVIFFSIYAWFTCEKEATRGDKMLSELVKKRSTFVTFLKYKVKSDQSIGDRDRI